MDNRLLNIINEIVESKTMTLSAVDSVKELKDKYQALLQQLETCKRDYQSANDWVKTLRQENTDLKDKCEIQKKALDGFAAKENKYFEQEVQARYAEMRRNDTLDLVRLIFRSPVTVQQVESSGSTYQPVGNGTTSTVYCSNSENKTVKTSQE